MMMIMMMMIMKTNTKVTSVWMMTRRNEAISTYCVGDEYVNARNVYVQRQ